MKITKQQLRRIILEELTMSSVDKLSPKEVETEMRKLRRRKYNQDDLSDQEEELLNKLNDINNRNRKGVRHEGVKIGRDEIRKMIQEEKQKLIAELGFPPGRGQRELPRGRGYDALVSRLADEVSAMIGNGLTREDAMQTVLTREDLHNDAMIRGHIESELRDEMVPVPANESRVYKLNKATAKRLAETVKSKLISEVMQADPLDYEEVFDIAVDPNDKREIMIKLADRGLQFDEDAYLDALDDYLRR